MTKDNERILDLCRKVSIEKDGGKMTQLIRQLNEELDGASDKKEPEQELEKENSRAARRA